MCLRKFQKKVSMVFQECFLYNFVVARISPQLSKQKEGPLFWGEGRTFDNEE